MLVILLSNLKLLWVFAVSSCSQASTYVCLVTLAALFIASFMLCMATDTEPSMLLSQRLVYTLLQM